MQIRDLAPDEHDEAIDLWEATGLTRPWNPPRDDLARALDGATSTVLGGFDGPHLVASVMVGHDGHRGWVYYLAVSPDRQGHGLGRQMMSAAERWLIEHGAVKVQLMVRRTNTSVISFYERLGFNDADVKVLAKWL